MKNEMDRQKILVIEQHRKGKGKIAGIRRYGNDRFSIHVISIDDPLPAVIDDTTGILPDVIEADLVLDYLVHPDLSHDLAGLCAHNNVPMIASGKKWHFQGVYTPPT